VEIEQLKNHFANIRIRAPRNSFAKIRIEFFNSWQITNAKHVFYYRDQKNERTLVEDIYQDQGVYLDEDCCFQLMLLCDESYAIEDRATLRITIRSWTK
jgi:hypothetical protein